MDIEERAEKWVNEHVDNPGALTPETRQLLVDAYLAGSAQTQRDYLSYFGAQGVVRGLRHP